MNDSHDVGRRAQIDQSTAMLADWDLHRLKKMADEMGGILGAAGEAIEEQGGDDPVKCEEIMGKTLIGVPSWPLICAVAAFNIYIQQRIDAGKEDGS